MLICLYILHQYCALRLWRYFLGNYFNTALLWVTQIRFRIFNNLGALSKFYFEGCIKSTLPPSSLSFSMARKHVDNKCLLLVEAGPQSALETSFFCVRDDLSDSQYLPRPAPEKIGILWDSSKSMEKSERRL